MFLVARHTEAPHLAGIGIEPLGSPITAGEAATASFAGVAVLHHGPDTVFITGDQALLTGGRVLAQLLGREVVTALFGAATGSYLWRVDAPGVERTWLCQGGETLDETGLAGPEEAGVKVIDQEGLLAMLALRTGFGSTDAWRHETAQPITWPPAGAKPAAKKRWFAKP